MRTLGMKILWIIIRSTNVHVAIENKMVGIFPTMVLEISKFIKYTAWYWQEYVFLHLKRKYFPLYGNLYFDPLHL